MYIPKTCGRARWLPGRALADGGAPPLPLREAYCPDNNFQKEKGMGKKKKVSDMTDPAMLRRIQNMRLMDDELMTVVFSGNIPATELLLRTVLSRDDLKVKSSMTQREKRNLYGRSVRLDIVAEDTAGKRYNVEVQRADKGAAPRRVRYNLAMIDSHTLRRKQDFSVLPETFIIFITENDYLEQGKPFYKVRKVFENTAVDGKGDLPFNDGCTIIYVNGSYRGEDPASLAGSQ